MSCKITAILVFYISRQLLFFQGIKSTDKELSGSPKILLNKKIPDINELKQQVSLRQDPKSITAKQSHTFDQIMGEQEFRNALSKLLQNPVQISFTHNRSTLISVRTNNRGIKKLRLQHAFRAVDKSTLQSLAFFVDEKEFDPQVIDNFLSKKQDLVKFFSRERKETQSIVHRGKFRDLEKVLKKVTDDYGLVIKGIRIAWSRAGKISGRKFSIRFGSFSASKGLIRIHPELDSPEIPDYFVEFVVYHELLHAIYPPESLGEGARRRVHPSRFRAQERQFKQYKKAIEFEHKFVKMRLG